MEALEREAARGTWRSRVVAGLVAGMVAIILNTLALAAAELVPLATARGGLLRLLSPWAAVPLNAWGIAPLWRELGLPGPGDAVFQMAFHLLVGLAMAVFYALLLENRLPGRAYVKGLIYAVAVWLLNAAIVLPLTGEGFAGSLHLTLPGMLWFAAAHSLFFVMLAVLYAWLRHSRRGWSCFA